MASYPNIDTELLRSFVAIADHGGFTRPQLRSTHMVGAVRIGTPDDYVMRFLPGILARFAQAYPLVQVEVHCEPSSQLLQRRDLDLSIITREPGTEIGQLLRQEYVVWAAAPGFNLDDQRHCRWPLSIPTASAAPGCATRWTPARSITGSPIAAPASRPSWPSLAPGWRSPPNCKA